ncbi:MAG: ArnT family glycosyltransferase [Candidatus Binatia bacterium]
MQTRANRLTTGSGISATAAGSPWLWATSAALLAFVVAFPLARRFIVLSDEGLLLMQALDILKGKVLYRDMDAFVTPGIWYLLAGVFAVVKPTVLAGRMVALIGFALMALVCFRVTDRLAPRIYAWAAVGGLLVTYVWAFPAWTFPFYSQYAVLFALAALDRVLAWRADLRARDLLLAGLCVGLSVAFKQNYGALTLAGLGVALIAVQMERGAPGLRAVAQALLAGLWVGFGVMAVMLTLFAYFAQAHALRAVWQSLFVHPFTFGSDQSIAYLSPAIAWRPEDLVGTARYTYGAVPWAQVGSPGDWWQNAPLSLSGIERLHVLLYWFPPAAFAAAFVLAWWPRRSGQPIAGDLACVSLVGSAVFLGVFPRADFAHLMNVYQPVILITTVLAHRLIAHEKARGPRWWVRLRIVLPAGVLAAYGFTGLFWYNRLRVHFNTPLVSERTGMLEDSLGARLLDEEVAFIQRVTQPGDALLTVPDLIMFNFLADREVPSYYYNLYEHHIAHDAGAAVVAGAEAHHVNWMVTRYDNFFSDSVPLRKYAPTLWTYLRTHFEIAFTRPDDAFLFLHRRPEPLPASAVTDVLANCDQPAGRDAPQVIGDHLLFTTLDQYSDPSLPFVGTRCTVTVPDHGDLVVGVGYTRPAEVEIGAELVADLWVLSFEGAAHLLHETLPIVPAEGWIDPRWKEHRFDLGRYARQRVTLVFRVTQHGAADADPLDMRGFALQWLDPHIESPRTFVVPGVD